AFEVTLSVLVVTCPCALALATPAAFAAAGSRLAELKLLLTNGNAIEALSRATRILFDKTGTLTFGRPVVAEVEVMDTAYTETQCLELAAALESASSHPIAMAFADVGFRHDVMQHATSTGEGLAATIDGVRWRIGKPDFVAPGTPKSSTNSAGTSVYLGRDQQIVARFVLEDGLRPDAEDTIAWLKRAGLEPALLSGDAPDAVAAAAERLGIDRAIGDCSPQDKLEAIRALQADGHVVVMVGDGINDAPVLSGSDASIAPAHAARLAQTSADIILLGDSLAPVVTVIGMARRTMQIVRQNLVWAIVYNALALPLAALGLVPPWAAAIGMSASSLIVVLNALRLGSYR
ncbi:MAG: HAD-IC family P-type ATPase, partial [Pseudomonadota bacterium]